MLQGICTGNKFSRARKQKSCGGGSGRGTTDKSFKSSFHLLLPVQKVIFPRERRMSSIKIFSRGRFSWSGAGRRGSSAKFPELPERGGSFHLGPTCKKCDKMKIFQKDSEGKSPRWKTAPSRFPETCDLFPGKSRVLPNFPNRTLPCPFHQFCPSDPFSVVSFLEAAIQGMYDNRRVHSCVPEWLNPFRCCWGCWIERRVFT